MLHAVKTFFRSKYFLWLLLMIPGIMMAIGLMRGKMSYESFMHATGEFSARFMVFTLIASPLMVLLPGKAVPKWFVRTRRYFGVAAFAYALFHTIYYLYELPAAKIMGEFWDIAILTGWIATFVFTLMGITSNDFSERKMGRNWKRLQRFTYLAAICIVLHWMLIHNNPGPALVHFSPVLILQILRIWKSQQSRSRLRA